MPAIPHASIMHACHHACHHPSITSLHSTLHTVIYYLIITNETEESVIMCRGERT